MFWLKKIESGQFFWIFKYSQIWSPDLNFLALFNYLSQNIGLEVNSVSVLVLG